MANDVQVKSIEESGRTRWIVLKDGKPVNTVGRRVGKFGSREDAESYAASRFGK